MKLTDVVIEVRDENLKRVGQIKPSQFQDLTAVIRFNGVGSWKVTAPVGEPIAEALKTPGYGIIISTDQGTLLSGPTMSVQRVQTIEDPEGLYEISGLDDSVLLGERLAYPVPTTDDLTLQIAAYDERTGLVEDVIKEYVNANIGPSAPLARRVAGLSIQPSEGRGTTTTAKARFETLQDLIGPIANTAGFGFTVEQVGDGLEFQVYEPVDRSADIRLDIANNRVSKTEYTYTAPNATHIVVGGSGEAENRLLIERTNDLAIEAEATWKRRREHFLDDRSSKTTTEMAIAGDAVLVEDGKTITNTVVTPSDDETTMRYNIDWNLGDKVAVVVGNQQTTATVTEVGISINDDGIRIGATIGTPAPISFEAKLVAKAADQELRVSNLERNESGLVATTTKQLVNNRTGATLLKGQAVYINGAQGNRVTVALAQADAESTSSKTFGIVESNIANNESGYILTEGSLAGLNTSAYAEGSALWLSPTTAGGWSTTKPVAPNHMVLVGFVERSQQINGSLFVKVQNGFELDELHTVKITNPTDGQYLRYQASTGLWVNSN